MNKYQNKHEERIVNPNTNKSGANINASFLKSKYAPQTTRTSQEDTIRSATGRNVKKT